MLFQSWYAGIIWAGKHVYNVCFKFLLKNNTPGQTQNKFINVVSAWSNTNKIKNMSI